MEERVTVPHPMPTVSVPVGTQDPTASTEVATAHNQKHKCMGAVGP